MPNRFNRNYQDDGISNARRDRQLATLKAIYEMLPSPDPEFRTVLYADIAQRAGLTVNNVTAFVRGLDRCDVIRRNQVGRMTDGEVSLALPLTQDQALDKLFALWEQEKRERINLTMPVDKKMSAKFKAAFAKKRETQVQAGPLTHATVPIDSKFTGVVIANDHSEITRAIAGPEPTSPFAALAPLRKDEFGALVEAVRQYADRKNQIAATLTNLKSLGVEINDDLFARAINVPKDERMEALTQVLPYVTKLENMVEHQGQVINDLRDKMKDYTQIKSDLEKLRNAWQRRVSADVSAGKLLPDA